MLHTFIMSLRMRCVSTMSAFFRTPESSHAVYLSVAPELLVLKPFSAASPKQ